MPTSAIASVVVKANDEENESFASRVLSELDNHNVFALSLQGGCGCGKTTLIKSAIKCLSADRRCAVIVGDTAMSIDAEQIAETGVPVVQINPDGGCHLSANMVLEALSLLNLNSTDILLIENIGNLHCAARIGLGTHRRLACLSTSAGLQVLDKYPRLFETSDVNLITKSDLAEYVRFDVPRAVSRLRKLNGRAKVLVTDAYSGDGIDMLCRCIRREMDDISCLP